MFHKVIKIAMFHKNYTPRPETVRDQSPKKSEQARNDRNASKPSYCANKDHNKSAGQLKTRKSMCEAKHHMLSVSLDDWLMQRKAGTLSWRHASRDLRATTPGRCCFI